MSNAINPKRESKTALSENHLQSLLYLCDALASLSDPIETALILRDIFSPQEMITVANRLHIAALLIDGRDYKDIKESLGVGLGTISRISSWLETYGDGYRLLSNRISFREIRSYESKGSKHTYKRNSQYLWPATLIAGLHSSMSKDNAYQILSILINASKNQRSSGSPGKPG